MAAILYSCSHIIYREIIKSIFLFLIFLSQKKHNEKLKRKNYLKSHEAGAEKTLEEVICSKKRSAQIAEEPSINDFFHMGNVRFLNC